MSRTPPINFKTHANRNLRVRVFQRDDFTCQGCGWRPAVIPSDYDGRFTIGPWPNHADRTLHIDHVIARAFGGPSEEENLRTLCESCNCRKAGRR